MKTGNCFQDIDLSTGKQATPIQCDSLYYGNPPSARGGQKKGTELTIVLVVGVGWLHFLQEVRVTLCLKNEKVLPTKADVEKEGGGRSFVLQKNNTAKV